MKPSANIPATPEEASRQAAELAALLRMLDASRGCFSLSVAVCNSPALRDYLIQRSHLDFPDAEVVDVPLGAADVFAAVERGASDERRSALFVIGLERLLDSTADDQPVLRALNASRELWERRFLCPVVFWVPEYASVLMARRAPDFWRYRSHAFEFVSEAVTGEPAMSDRFAGDVGAAANLSAEEKHFRIAELEQRLGEAGDDVAAPLVEHVLLWQNELAFLYERTGELDQAELILRKALAIDEKLGRLKGMASDYGNLGLIYRKRGDLDQAEALYRKSLAINEKLGRLKGMANQYGNLGLIYEMRGDLDQAEALHRKALEIDEKLGRLEGMASDYGNLGLIYLTRGDLEQAEAMHRKSLAINEKLGWLEGLASQYGNLGNVMLTRGDLVQAREFWTQARDLYQRIGLRHLVERVQSLLDRLPDDRGTRRNPGTGQDTVAPDPPPRDA